MDQGIFAGIPTEGASLVDEQENKTSASSQEEKKIGMDNVPSQGGKEKTLDGKDQKIPPFHTHPRWKEMQSKLHEKEEVIETLKKDIEDIKIRQNAEKGDQQPIPKWFSNQFGEDEQAWSEYQSYQTKIKDEIKQEILDSQEELYTKEQREFQKNEDYVNQELQSLIDDGYTSLQSEKGRTDFLKFATKYPVFNGDKIDLQKIMELYKTQANIKDITKKDARKEIASMTASGYSNDDPVKKPQTSATLRNKSWRDFIGQ